MRKKVGLSVSCFVCICLFVCSVLPVQAAACPHTICRVLDVPIKTGNITFNESGHMVEYGIEHTCASCGYRFFTNTETKFEEHQCDNDAWHLTTDENGKEFWYSNCITPGCNYRKERRYY